MDFKSILFLISISIVFFAACGDDDDQNTYWQEGQPCGGPNRIIIDGSCRCPEEGYFSLARMNNINPEGGCHQKNKQTWLLETDCPCENGSFREGQQMAVGLLPGDDDLGAVLYYWSSAFLFTNTTYTPIENGGDYLRFEVELNTHMDCWTMCGELCRGVVEGYFSEDDKIGDFTLDWYALDNDKEPLASCKWRMYRDW